jgi:hypothetical protein
MDVAPAERAVKPRPWHGRFAWVSVEAGNHRRHGKIPLIPVHSASLRAFTPVFDGLSTRVNALMAEIQG